MRRPILKIAVVLAILALVTTLASYVLLLTALPGQWILDAVHDRLGLTVTAESFSLGWTGRTRIQGLTVRTPLNDEEILSVSEIQLSHHALPWLALTRSLGLDAIQISDPNLRVRRDGEGRWNVQDIWNRINAGRQPDSPSNGRVSLPSIDVKNAVVHLSDANGVAATLGPLDVEGRPEKGSLWRFTLRTAPQIAVQGRVAQGYDWTHTLGFDIQAISPLLQALHGPNIAPIETAGRWEGRLVANALVGRLELDRLQCGALIAQGTVAVEAQAAGVTLRPAGFTINEPNFAGAPVRLTAGTLRADAHQVQVEGLAVTTGDVTASFDGQWENDTSSGILTGSWGTSSTPDDFRYRGTCRIAVKSPPRGRKEADLDVTAHVQAAGGTGAFTAKVRGTGNTWQNSVWQLSLGDFTWNEGEKQYDMAGAVAQVALDWPSVELTSLQLPTAQRVQAQAQLDAATTEWSARIDVNDLRAKPWTDDLLDVRFDAHGDGREVTLSQFGVTQGQRTVALAGEFSIAEHRIQTAHLSAQWPVGAPDATTKTPASGKPGRWQYEAEMSGGFRPTALQVKGTLSGVNVPLGKKLARQVDVMVRADIDQERIVLSTDPFTLLDGQWHINGQHNWSNELTQLSLLVDGLSLKSAADMAGSPLACQGRVHAELQLALPGLDLQETVALGAWRANDVEIPPFRADSAKGRMRIADGLVQFSDIHLEEGRGEATGHMQFRLDRPQHLTTNFEATSWPIRLEDQALEFRLNGTGDAQLDVVAKTIDGQGRLSGAIRWKDKEYGQMTLATRMAGRTLTVEQFQAQGLNGHIEGLARIPLDKWTQSTGRLEWNGIEPNALEADWPAAARIAGQFSGSLVARQSDQEQRPLEPIRLELQTQARDGRFGAAQLQDSHVVAYLGPRRLLIERADFHVLDGYVGGRARISPHIGKLYTNVVMDINDVNLPQLVQAIHPEAAAVVGRLTGRGTLLFSSDLRSLSGQADLTLSKSDLANNGVIRALYDTLNLNLGSKQPEGTGQIRIQLDGRRTKIPSFVYFNRGVEIRGTGQIDNLSLGAASPVTGYAFGSTRVLKGIALPGVRALDRLMSSLQSGVASVKIDGTLGKPKPAVVPLPTLSDPVRRLLWAQLRGGQQTPSEQ